MDVVVCVPKTFGLQRWIDEGDPAGAEWSGTEWVFSVPAIPKIEPGERVYVVCEELVRGYAPLIRIDQIGHRRWGLIRGGGAEAVTIHQIIRGFQGFRYRWWDRSEEVPFLDWMKP